MADLPTGTLTFLFTDIAGSSRLWEQFPEPMQQAHARHGEIITACVIQHGGCFVRKRGEGDSTFSVFIRATDALAACCDLQRALAAQQWPADTPLTVRAALHVGTGNLLHADYNSTDVNRCAHLRSLAHGEQTVLSQTTYELVKNALPQDVTLRDLGWHGLKNLQEPEHVWQMCHPALRAEFPPLNSLNTLPNNLPRPLSSFIGRDEEIRMVKALLRTHPLVTLTGTGGAGKTRLALEVGADILEQKEHGVWFVEFAALRDAALVPQTVIAALGLREEPGRDLTATLQDYLKTRKLLLILDNCEHLIQTCALLADTLLRACPELRILATSREALNIVGEEAWRVPSLSLPDSPDFPMGEKDVAALLMEFDAVNLFVERARQRQRGFQLDRQNAPAIVDIVRRLDGIPLALELAAARLNFLSLTDLATRLEDCFALLTNGSRTALPRHQTLRALIDWSFDLLTAEEKALFVRLSVFSGGCTLEAVEAVCAGGSEGEILDTLASLVDKSLVDYLPGKETGRYRLLETMRQYAHERLDTSKRAQLRNQHYAFFLALAEQANVKIQGTEQQKWLTRLETEHDNLRTALNIGLETDDAKHCLHLAVALLRFWQMRGLLVEGGTYYNNILCRQNAQNLTQERADALFGAGMFAFTQGDYTTASAYSNESLSIYRVYNHQRGIISVLNNLASIAKDQSDYQRAEEHFKEILDICHTIGHRAGESIALNNMGSMACARGDYVAAHHYHSASIQIKRELGSKHGIASSLINLGALAQAKGDWEQASACYEEALSLQRAIGDKMGIAASLINLGSVACRQGNLDVAQGYLVAGLQVSRDIKLKFVIAYALEAFAELAQLQAHLEHAAQFYGAAHTLREAMKVPLLATEQREQERHIATLRATLGEEAYEANYQQGGSLPLEQIIADTLAMWN